MCLLLFSNDLQRKDGSIILGWDISFSTRTLKNTGGEATYFSLFFGEKKVKTATLPDMGGLLFSVVTFSVQRSVCNVRCLEFGIGVLYLLFDD